MRTAFLLTLASLLLLGCDTQSPSRFAASPAAPASPAASPSGERQLMAMVNGQPLYMDDLQELLLEDYGPSLCSFMVTCEVAEAQAVAANLTITQEDIGSEEDLEMEQVFGFLPDPQQRYKLLEQELARRNMSTKHWKLVLRRNAQLRKLVGPGITVSEKELRQQFEQTYGGKVVVRHIQTASLHDAEGVLAKVRAGEDFAELAKEVSTNATARDGGLLPPIGTNSALLPPAIAKASLAMTKPGELAGPIQVGTAYHVLRLEKTIPAKDVRFEDVKGEVTAAAKRHKTQTAVADLLKNLMAKTKVEYVNPFLRQQAQDLAKR